eukprot:13708263-Alexandrium_andersonii.AAC.1
MLSQSGPEQCQFCGPCGAAALRAAPPRTGALEPLVVSQLLAGSRPWRGPLSALRARLGQQP